MSDALTMQRLDAGDYWVVALAKTAFKNALPKEKELILQSLLGLYGSEYLKIEKEERSPKFCGLSGNKSISIAYSVEGQPYAHLIAYPFEKKYVVKPWFDRVSTADNALKAFLCLREAFKEKQRREASNE